MFLPLSLTLAAVLAGPPPSAPAPDPGPDRAFPAGVSSPVAADTLYDLGRFHGVSDAREASTGGDFVRGFGWSLVAGPLGGFIAVRRARSAEFPLPEGRRSSFLELGVDYRDGYHDGFETFYPTRRREATIGGAMLGSLAFGFILLQVVELPSRRRFEGQFPDGDPPFVIYSIPVGGR